MTVRPAVLAVDGGNSKTDVALVAADGTLLAAVRGPTSSHQAVGLERGMSVLAELVTRAALEAESDSLERPFAPLAVYGLAGADYPSDVRLLSRAIEALRLAERDVIVNDTFGALRAGAQRPWGVVLICGQGINGAGVAPNGRQVRFDGVGAFSGDWGGGGAVGLAGHAAAVRARDGRGPRTVLVDLVPAHFGQRSPEAVTRALYEGRIPGARLAELSPIVFLAARNGDAVARGIIDRLADELVAMARALIRRLHLTRRDPDVVLAGGVFRADDASFLERIEQGVRSVAPGARIVRLTAPPVLGAALIGLDAQSPGRATEPAVEERLRAAMERWSPVVS